MLHTKFQVPEKKVFGGFLLYLGMAAILDPDAANIFPPPPPRPRKFNIKFGYDWPSGFLDV